MNILSGIKNFIQFINDNWTAICVLLSLLFIIYSRIKKYLKMSDEEKIFAVKKQIKEIILKLVAEAEFNYEDLAKSGAIKRSQVIEKIFSTYPILLSVVDQESIVSWIDELIDDALKTMREIFLNNSN